MAAMAERSTALTRWIDRWSDRTVAWFLVAMGFLGYAFAVRLPSVGFNARLYATFGAYVNEHGALPARDEDIGTEPFSGSYADFPALSLRVYQLLANFGEQPNRFVWAAYYLIPLTIACIALARWGGRIALPRSTARLCAATALLIGIWTARGYEDKAHFFWLPVAAILIASWSPLAGAATTGVFAGWTGLVPLAPLLVAMRRGQRRVALFLVTAVVALGCAFAFGAGTLTLLANRRSREAPSTFWFGFWQLLGPLDTASVRMAFAALMGILIAYMYFRGWLSFPAALVGSAISLLCASPSFGNVRYWMVLPLAVFLIRTPKWQSRFLIVVAVWSALPLADFTTQGSYFVVDDTMGPARFVFLLAYTNVPVLAVIALVLRAVQWRAPFTSLPTSSIFESGAAATAKSRES
jgi:hypothetical protein